MTEYYSREETQRQKKRLRGQRIAAGCAGALGLVLCIFLCLRVNTLNAPRLLLWVIGVSAASGWTVILLHNLSIAPLKADIQHSEGILRGSAEEFTGQIHVDPMTFRIPRSIRVKKVRLVCGEETLTLHVSEKRAAKLPPGGTMVRVKTVNRYIAGCEVCHE